MNQNGSDGVLTETLLESDGTVVNSIETFDQKRGTTTKVVRKTVRDNASVEPVVSAVAGTDVGVVDVEQDKVGIERDDLFAIMNPVSSNKITGDSRMPERLNVVPNYLTNNHSSSQVMFALYRDKSGDDAAGMSTYDTSKNRWGKRKEFPRDQLFDTNGRFYAAIDAAANEDVAAYLGRQRYNPRESPTFLVMDAGTGKVLRSFKGVGEGFVNGMAIDSTTGIMCTTTTRDSDVEFYKLSTGKDKTVQIPVCFW